MDWGLPVAPSNGSHTVQCSRNTLSLQISVDQQQGLGESVGLALWVSAGLHLGRTYPTCIFIQKEKKKGNTFLVVFKFCWDLGATGMMLGFNLLEQ